MWYTFFHDGSPSPIYLIAVVNAESPQQSSDSEPDFEGSGTTGGDQASAVSTSSRTKGRLSSSPKSTPKLRSRSRTADLWLCAQPSLHCSGYL